MAKAGQSRCCGLQRPDEARKAEAQAALSAAQAATAVAQAQASAADAMLQPAVDLVASWGGRQSELAAAESARAALVDRLFAQPHWQAEPQIASAMAAIADLQRQANHVRRENTVPS